MQQTQGQPGMHEPKQEENTKTLTHGLIKKLYPQSWVSTKCMSETELTAKPHQDVYRNSWQGQEPKSHIRGREPEERFPLSLVAMGTIRKRSGLRSQFDSAMWHWASYLITLALSVFICKMEETRCHEGTSQGSELEKQAWRPRPWKTTDLLLPSLLSGWCSISLGLSFPTFKAKVVMPVPVTYCEGVEVVDKALCKRNSLIWKYNGD